MIDSIRTWLLGIVLTAFAVALARQLAPKGREQAVVRLAGGLLLTIVFLKPLQSFSIHDISLSVGGISVETEEQYRYYREKQQNDLEAIIVAKTESYIWDKANELGLECATVTVKTLVGENGIPLPDEVTIVGTRSSTLSAWIEEVVGIPAEKQIWLEGANG